MATQLAPSPGGCTGLRVKRGGVMESEEWEYVWWMGSFNEGYACGREFKGLVPLAANKVVPSEVGGRAFPSLRWPSHFKPPPLQEVPNHAPCFPSTLALAALTNPPHPFVYYSISRSLSYSSGFSFGSYNFVWRISFKKTWDNIF